MKTKNTITYDPIVWGIYPGPLDHILLSWRIPRVYFDTIRTLGAVVDG